MSRTHAPANSSTWALRFTLAALAALAFGAMARPAAAGQAPTLTALLSPDYRSVSLHWTGVPGPSGGFLIERSLTGSESAPREWVGIADVTVTGQGGGRPDASPATVAYLDEDVTSAGWFCYRVRAKADDFAWSNEACVPRPVVDGPPPATSDIPVPAAVRWEALVQPPDLGGVLRIFAWDWPEAGGFDAVVEASVQPRGFSDVIAPFRTYARIAGTEPPRISVTTLNWRGPYCFRVRFAAGDELGEPSAAACIPRTVDAAPYDIQAVRTRQIENPNTGPEPRRTVELSWEYRYFPTSVTVQRANGARPAEEDWRTIADGVPARVDQNIGRFVDTSPLTGYPGHACYRVKANVGDQLEFGEDALWSPETCIAWPRPISDPAPPDVGNSLSLYAHPRGFAFEATVAGAVLALVGITQWWLLRGYRRPR